MEALGSATKWLEERLYPELERIAPHQRRRAMEHARAESFDTLELIGILAAVAAAAYITKSGIVTSMAEHFWAALMSFVLAVPLLVLIAGPFYVRRNRRGLRAFLSPGPTD